MSPYKINVHCGSENGSNCDISAYYELRKRVFIDKLGPEQAVYYGRYPTEHDQRQNTIFLVFKATDPETGGDVVFGGRRIVLLEPRKVGTLPFEGKHEITNRKAANRFTTLINKQSIDVGDVIPALKKEPDIKCAELGGFAIDQSITHRLFTREEYIRMREDIYQQSLDAAKKAGVDIVLIEPGGNNLPHQEEWLKSSGKYEFRRLGQTRSLFSNPFPRGKESEMLLINVSGRYKLTGPESILRFNQDAAQGARSAKADMVCR